MESLVVTVIGKDRPGLVELVSAVVEEHGGEKIQLVASLNDSPIWIDTVEEMVREVM